MAMGLFKIHSLRDRYSHKKYKLLLKMFYFNVYFRSFIGKIVYTSAVLNCPYNHLQHLLSSNNSQHNELPSLRT